MKILEILESSITGSIGNIDEQLKIIAEYQEEIDNQSFTDDDPNLAKDYAALEAMSYVLKNHKKALNNPDLMHNSYFLYTVDDGVVAAIHGILEDNVLELKWIGSISPGEGKKLIDKIITLAKGDGATKIKLTAKWESDEYYIRHGFKQVGDKIGRIFTGGDYEKELKF